MTDPPTPSPGWYPDPDQAQTQRYWDGEVWTEQRAPLVAATARLSTSTGWVPIAVALLGAGVAGIATFLPQVEAQGFARIAENTLIQSGDGILIIILALVGAAAAYSGRDRPRLTWIAVLTGLLIVSIAIYDGTGDRLQLTGSATDSADWRTALDAIAGEQGSPGVGLWAAGIGGAFLAVGGFLVGREGRSLKD